MSHLTQEFIEEMKAKLLAEQERLEGEVAAFEVHTEIGNSEEDNAEEAVMDEVSSDVRARINADLEKIAKALSKIEEGTYGVDEEGKEISEARLRALPWADKAI